MVNKVKLDGTFECDSETLRPSSDTSLLRELAQERIMNTYRDTIGHRTLYFIRVQWVDDTSNNKIRETCFKNITYSPTNPIWGVWHGDTDTQPPGQSIDDSPDKAVAPPGLEPPYPHTLAQLVEGQVIQANIAEMLTAAVKAKANIIVAGGDLTSRRNMLRCLTNAISDDEKIITIDRYGELGVARFKNNAETQFADPGEYKTAMTYARHNMPARVILSEPWSDTEPVFLALCLEHEGQMASIHCADGESVLEDMALSISMETALARTEVAALISKSIDLLLIMGEDDTGSARLEKIIVPDRKRMTEYPPAYYEWGSWDTDLQEMRMGVLLEQGCDWLAQKLTDGGWEGHVLPDIAPLPKLAGEQADWFHIPIGLGLSENPDSPPGCDPNTVTINLRNDAHMLISGGIASGKTHMLNTIGLVACQLGFEVDLIAAAMGGGLSAVALAEVNIGTVAENLETAETLLESLYNEMKERQQICTQNTVVAWYDLPEDIRPKPKLLLIEDTIGLLELSLGWGSKAGMLLARLASEAKSAGIHIIATTTRHEDNILDGNLKRNLSARVLLGSASQDARDCALRYPDKAPQLIGYTRKGIGVFDCQRQPGRVIQTFSLPEKSYAEAADELGVAYETARRISNPQLG